MENNELNEHLKRYRELLSYDIKKGGSSLTERRHKPYLAEEPEEGEDNSDFDFGDEGDQNSQEKGGGNESENEDFDFGDEGEGDFGGNDDFDFGGETDTEEEVDEFGTADEFSAADDIENGDDSDVEEIDVTDIVKRADDAKGYAEKAVAASEEGKNMMQDLMTKFTELQQSLGAINTVKDEVSSIKRDLQAQKPVEKLELRSLDSYPFNIKLTDYWDDVSKKGNYEITDGSNPDAESQDGQVKVWKLDPEEAKDFNTTDIKSSFIPESKSRKK